MKIFNLLKGAMVQPLPRGEEAGASQQRQQQKPVAQHQQHAGCLNQESGAARDRLLHLFRVVSR